MPLFLDLHELPEGITAQHVAEMHQADLDLEHHYHCRGLTYWCDEKRKTAFCLIDAPNKQALIDLHENAHGAIPTRIIEVNDTIVESFLGRIEDPEKARKLSLNIINEPAFRTIMVVTLNRQTLRTSDLSILKIAISQYATAIKLAAIKNKGRVVKQKDTYALLSFESVTRAINCGINIHNAYNSVSTPDLKINIGISAGIPVTDKEHIFEDTINTSEHLSAIAKGSFTITSAVKDLYESENQNKALPMANHIQIVYKSEQEFLKQLITYTEDVWTRPRTNVNDFEAHLGLSKSKLYRTMLQLVGKSPNIFLRDYRLNKALELLENRRENISEIAYQTGFSSPAYFSKCFHKKYGILPSNFRS